MADAVEQLIWYVFRMETLCMHTEDRVLVFDSRHETREEARCAAKELSKQGVSTFVLHLVQDTKGDGT